MNRNSLALRGPSSQGCTNHSTPQTPMVTTGSQNSRVVAGDDEVAGPGQHQAAGDAFAVHFGDGRLGEVAPAPRDLQIDFLLARKAAMGVGFGKAAPISDRRKIHAGFILAAGAQVMARRKNADRCRRE